MVRPLNIPQGIGRRTSLSVLNKSISICKDRETCTIVAVKGHTCGDDVTMLVVARG
jgi:hypothetical protein